MDNNLDPDLPKKAKKGTWWQTNLLKKWNLLNRSPNLCLKWHRTTWSDSMTKKSDLLLNINLVTWCSSKQPMLKLNNHQRNSTIKNTVHSRSSKRKDSCHTTSSWTNRGIRSTPSSMNAYFIHITRVISHLRNNHHHLPLRSYLM